MKQQIQEIFGRGYSLSYRWYRVCELFSTSYYELTIIPTIVLGCITALAWYGINYFTEGFAYITTTQFFSGFILFFVLFTAEDIFKWICKSIISMVESSIGDE